MNLRTAQTLIAASVLSIVVFAGSAELGAAQMCDPYVGCSPDPMVGGPVYVDPMYDPGYVDPGYIDPMYGPTYVDPMTGCDPILGCVNVVTPADYAPVYVPVCDQYGVCY
jgi:hypothetical protein